MGKQITIGTEGRKKMADGVNKVADAVKVTMGAKGRNVVIENPFGSPHITKDGVTVAKSITLTDPIENMGAMLIKEVASKTVETSGDGTSLSTVLTQAIINMGLDALDKGASPQNLKNGIDKQVKSVVEYLKSISQPADTLEALRSIATISANGDRQMGELIADAFHKIGKDGLVTVEESKGSETKVTIVEGMKLDYGYVSPYFVTNPQKVQAEMQQPCILVYDGKVSAIAPLMTILTATIGEGKEFLLIADEIEGEALAALCLNKVRNNMKVCAVKFPAMAQDKKQVMEDLCVILGGQYISEEKGFQLEKIKVADLGTCESVVVKKESCMFIGGAGTKEAIDARCEELKMQIEASGLETDTNFLKKRLANLQNGVAVISVGGFTDTEINEKKDRIDDAVCATRSAIEEGYVAGGGTAFLFAPRGNIFTNKEMNIGADILMAAIEAPFRQILINADIEDANDAKTVAHKVYGYGINANTGELIDFFAEGILDPTKVLRCALENAASIAGIFLTTECTINEETK